MVAVLVLMLVVVQEALLVALEIAQMPQVLQLLVKDMLAVTGATHQTMAVAVAVALAQQEQVVLGLYLVMVELVYLLQYLVLLPIMLEAVEAVALLMLGLVVLVAEVTVQEQPVLAPLEQLIRVEVAVVQFLQQGQLMLVALVDQVLS